jgi:hypothetical protein
MLDTVIASEWKERGNLVFRHSSLVARLSSLRLSILIIANELMNDFIPNCRPEVGAFIGIAERS